jgi:transcriptional regulator with XRE-family HTH domain
LHIIAILDIFAVLLILQQMNVTDNIKKFREERGMLQKQVAAEIGLNPAHYNKIEKGMVEPSIEVLDKLAKLFGVTIDQIVHYEGNIPKEVTVTDKTTNEKLQMIEQLEESDKQALYRMIDCMLTNNKFKDFFQKNVAAL